MNGVPKDLDLTPFLNREIGVVSLGQFIFTLVFEAEQLWIGCEGQVVVFENGKPTTIRSREWLDLSPLVRIQNIPVKDWRIESDSSFSLTLEGGTKILFVEDTPNYECFQIQMGKEFVVI